MIKHIVAFKLKNPEESHVVKSILMRLKDAVETVRLWEIGINIGSSSKPYEVVIYSEFDSMDDLAIFRDHPTHIEIKEAIAGYIETSGTIDYDSAG